MASTLEEIDPALERWHIAGLLVARTPRAIVRVDVDRIAKSCGYGVPLMEHVGERRPAVAAQT